MQLRIILMLRSACENPVPACHGDMIAVHAMRYSNCASAGRLSQQPYPAGNQGRQVPYDCAVLATAVAAQRFRSIADRLDMRATP